MKELAPIYWIYGAVGCALFVVYIVWSYWKEAAILKQNFPKIGSWTLFFVGSFFAVKTAKLWFIEASITKILPQAIGCLVCYLGIFVIGIFRKKKNI